MTKEEAQKLQPFDVVVYRTNKGACCDVLVKRVTEDGVFCIDRIQSTAALYRFEDLKFQ